MKLKTGFLILLLWLCCLESQAQIYPQHYFRYPLDSSPWFVSPFGALRDNHFHSGVDLKTFERTGLPVYASAFGYVSRIKIQSGGYGKAIYIDHPNGYSTVYGHLDAYYGAIAQWIHDYQYRNQVYEFDYIFPTPFLKVQLGDTIGFSGNSGTSTGPHLHFEIRHSKTEEIINPAFFGLYPADTLAPVIRQIWFYSFLPDGLFPEKKCLINDADLIPLSSNSFLYRDTIQLPSDVYGLGLETYDFVHNKRDEKNVYSYELRINDSLRFKYAMNRFAFAETKDINAHIDYPYYKASKIRIQKAFIDDGNQIRLYQTDARKGKCYLEPNQYYKLTLRVADVVGNEIVIQCWIHTTESHISDKKKRYLSELNSRYCLPSGVKKDMHMGIVKVQINPESLYDTVYAKLEYINLSGSPKKLAFRFHDPSTPIRKPMEMQYKVWVPKGIPASKLILLYQSDENSAAKAQMADYKNGALHASITNFGIYYPGFDTTAPTIQWLNAREDIEERKDTNAFYFRITDDLSGIQSYNVFLQGKWVLAEYDAKNQLLTYRKDEIYEQLMKERTGINESPLDFFIQVIDRKNNRGEKHFPCIENKK